MIRDCSARTDGKHRTVCRGVSAVAVACFLWGFFAGTGSSAWAQESARAYGPPAMNWPSASCPQPVTLPNVPVRTPRPAEGNAPELQWQTGVDPATPPTAAFIEPLRGNDAVIQVILGQTRLLTLKADLANEDGTGVIAVGDPTIVDFDLMPNPRLVRLISLRPGVTDLSIATADGEIYSFEVHVIYDLRLIEAQVRQIFPESQVRLSQLHGSLVVEGQVRSIRQADQVILAINSLMKSIVPAQKTQAGSSTGKATGSGERGNRQPASDGQAPDGQGSGEETSSPPADEQRRTGEARPEQGSQSNFNVSWSGTIINLLRVPGVHQVMLQVQIAELNRTALRGIGADMYYKDSSGRILGTNVSGAGRQNIFAEESGPEKLIGLLPGIAATGFALLPATQLDLTLRALRTNGVMSILAEPNLVAMSGQKAQFLAGGEIPIPVSTVTGAAAQVSIEWRQFGVQLEFQPFVLEDETIRLIVRPEESSLDYANAIEVSGSLVPAIATRQVTTTVEMRQGQTLAMAGLLRVSIEGNTRRIPGLGDLPYIGPFFSNTTHQRIEKELMILVTPYLVAPMNPDEVPCLPTDGITDPNDLEFYLLNRIEGRTGREFYPTREWDDPWGFRYLMHLEQSNCCGPVGFSPME